MPGLRMLYRLREREVVGSWVLEGIEGRTTDNERRYQRRYGPLCYFTHLALAQTAWRRVDELR